jgi:hypothetical protein
VPNNRINDGLAKAAPLRYAPFTSRLFGTLCARQFTLMEDIVFKTYNRIFVDLGNIPMRKFNTIDKQGFFRDGSFIPYIVEELISRSAFQVVFDFKTEGFFSSIPKALRERVEWIDSGGSKQKALNYLAPILDELEISTDGCSYSQKNKNSENYDNLYSVMNIASSIEKIFLAVEHNLQIDIDLLSFQSSLMKIRNALRGSEGRARIAVLQGIMGSYKMMDSPSLLAIPTAPEIIVEHFQRLINDSNYLELSQNAMQLGYIEKSKRSIEFMRRKIGDLLNNKYFRKGFNQSAKAISLATQVHIPETEVAESLLNSVRP